jgi:nitrile hydratase
MTATGHDHDDHDHDHDDHDHDHDEHDHEGHEHHEHAHDHGGVPHRHPFQPDDPKPPLESRVLEEALRTLLIDKGVFSAADIQHAMEAMDARGESQGAKIVARAWAVADYRRQLVEHPALALKVFGIDMGVNELCVVESTPDVHNIVVCTRYPRMILGVPPAWYKSREYRSRVVNEPRAVLAEFGVTLPEEVEVRVHDSNADLRYLVIPRRPPGTEGWSEEALATLVTRDSMIGTGVAREALEAGSASS